MGLLQQEIPIELKTIKDSVVIFATSNNDCAMQFDPKTKTVEILLGWNKDGKEVWVSSDTFKELRNNIPN